MTSAGIFLKGASGELIRMVEEPYASEDILQALLAQHPDLLVGSSGDSRPWLLVAREARIPDREGAAGRWSLDHLFLDQDGVPTLVEVKRATDTRIRREVVGQILDYAANALVHWPAGQVRALLHDRCQAEGIDPNAIMSGFLGADADTQAFWDAVDANFQERRVRLVFVADRIPDELRRIVEFLNDQMTRTEVLAVEVRQFAAPGDGPRTFVPTVLNQTVAAQDAKRTRRQQPAWNEQTFYSELERRSETVDVARRLQDWAETVDVWPRFAGGAEGSMQFKAFALGTDFPLFYVYARGGLNLQFGSLQKRPIFNDPVQTDALRRRLRAVPDVSIDDTPFPWVPLDALRPDPAFAAFTDAFAWVVAEILAAHRSAEAEPRS